MGVFLKNKCYDQFFKKLAVVRAKNANIFVKFFGPNILKNHNTGPWFILMGWGAGQRPVLKSSSSWELAKFEICSLELLGCLN
jgi:hypothetical protein